MNYCTDLEKMELLYNTVLCQLFFNSTECDQMFLYTKRIRDTEEKFLQDEVKETTWADLYREIAKLTGMPYDEEAEKPEKLKPKHKGNAYDFLLWPIVSSEARKQVAAVLASLPEKLKHALVELPDKYDGTEYRKMVLFFASVFVENGGKQIDDVILEKHSNRFADKELPQLLVSFFKWEAPEHNEKVLLDACRLRRLALFENCSVWSKEGCSVLSAFDSIPKQAQVDILTDLSSEDVANLLVPSLIAHWDVTDEGLNCKAKRQLLKLAYSGNISADVTRQVLDFSYPDGISINDVEDFMNAAESEKAVDNLKEYIDRLCEDA